MFVGVVDLFYRNSLTERKGAERIIGPSLRSVRFERPGATVAAPLMCGGGRRPPHRSAGRAPGRLARSGDGRTNVGRFMAAQGIDVRRAPGPLDRGPGLVLGCRAAFLGIPFATPYEQVLDTSRACRGRPGSPGEARTWRPICVDRWVGATPDAEAVPWEGEDGEVRVLT